jgi:4-azaleucine resistance transporter AzlC
MSRSLEFAHGCRDILPLILGAIPFGVIFGTLAVGAGLTGWQAMGMSTLVFAGSAQFIAITLITGGVGAAVVLLTTFVVNLRHALYSAALQPFVRHLPGRWRAPLAFWLTDEAFAVVQNRYARDDASPYKHWFFLGAALTMYVNWQLSTLVGIAFGQAVPDIASWGLDFAVVQNRYARDDASPYKHWFFLGAALTMYVNWQLSTLVGIAFGQAVPDIASWGLDFAMIATFIGIAVPMMRTRPQVASALVAGAVALLTWELPYKLGLIAAALAGIVIGVWLERRAEAAARPQGAL